MKTLIRTLLITLLYFVGHCVIASDAQSAVNNQEMLTEQNTVKDIKPFLRHNAETLSQEAIDSVASVLTCSNDSSKKFNNILAIIDYSLPSDKKRLWVFDLKEKKLLFHTYVSHGINSGVSIPDFFSNTNNSKTSSIGVFRTGKTYTGRYGLALKLEGLENHFNKNAINRALVMHSAWFVSEDFINKYGRLGRSWGCPAIPADQVLPVLKILQNQALLVVYHPSHQWLSKSKFLTCNTVVPLKKSSRVETLTALPEAEMRGDVLFIDKNQNAKIASNEPVVVMSAKNYHRIFNVQVPLERMLRRQIKNTEYIALNLTELQLLDTQKTKVISDHDNHGNQVLEFVIPAIKKKKGFYVREFQSAKIDKPIEIHFSQADPLLVTPTSNTRLKSTHKFIRWIGL
jgi:hypothetical protein